MPSLLNQLSLAQSVNPYCCLLLYANDIQDCTSNIIRYFIMPEKITIAWYNRISACFSIVTFIECHGDDCMLGGNCINKFHKFLLCVGQFSYLVIQFSNLYCTSRFFTLMPSLEHIRQYYFSTIISQQHGVHQTILLQYYYQSATWSYQKLVSYSADFALWYDFAINKQVRIFQVSAQNQVVIQ